MPSKEFLSRWRSMGGGWALAPLKAGPPPIPCHASTRSAPAFPIIGETNRSPYWIIDQTTQNAYLFDEGRQVGVLFGDGRGYFSLSSSGQWSGPCETPIPPPKKDINSPSLDDRLTATNFGVESGRISAERRYRLNGHECSEREAEQALSRLGDDSAHMRLTIIGSETLRKTVLNDIATHSELRELCRNWAIQDYPPDHWAVTGVGFGEGIVLQKPADERGRGEVIFRFREYAGPVALAGAIRKSDPNYRPDRDPNPNDPKPSPKSDPDESASRSPSNRPQFPPMGWGLLGLVGVWWILSKLQERKK